MSPQKTVPIYSTRTSLALDPLENILKNCGRSASKCNMLSLQRAQFSGLEKLTFKRKCSTRSPKSSCHTQVSANRNIQTGSPELFSCLL